MSLLKTNEIQNYNGSSLTLTASTVSTSAQLNTGGNISVTGSLNVSDDSTTRSNLGLGTIATQDSDSITVTGGTATLGALTVSGSDSGDLVRITQTGSGNALVVEDSTNPDSTPFVVDSSGNVLVGTTTYSGASSPQNSTSSADAGAVIESGGTLQIGSYQNSPLRLNRMSTDGNIAEFRKDGTTVGSISAKTGRLAVHSTATDAGGFRFTDAGGKALNIPCDNSGANTDDACDLGYSSARFDNIYATNGTIQTSDQNEKQDIEELSEAEQRVAVAAKSLMRKFRWKSAVAKKGDEARIHFGIIAQDFQAAFEAEGLDAGRYAMFILSTWWETQTEVPAVEAVDAVYDEEGNLLSEAVEAKEAYTRTDTYDTAEEAPEGAVERTRLGVRYSELLAFIIAAL